MLNGTLTNLTFKITKNHFQSMYTKQLGSDKSNEVYIICMYSLF